ncbi:MAG TPA: ADP-glyceromanno-heptose 6-epimerase [bacterium]|jgi:ADP-L-glycero-D-manno-heptose 6-epimerase|nr:ADP-glyceromanno-heptose 6-epimerase [bacterium]
MSLLITGAYGFIAARLAHSLLDKDQEKLVFVDKPDYRMSRSCVKGLENLPLIDREKLFDELPKLKNITAVIHLGACTDTGNHDQQYMWKMNTDYTKTLWQWCSEKKIPLIYASSGATYGRGDEGYSDDHRDIPKYKPLNVYGRSKHEFDLWALKQKAAPSRWYGLKFFNVYGYDENHKGRMASPIFHGYHEIQKTGKQTLFRSHKEGVADGEQKRDFIFVDDIVKLCLFCLEKNPPSGIYNCGTGQARTFLDVSKALFKAVGKEEKIEWVDTPEKFRAGYQYFTQADMGKMKAAGYQDSFLPIEEGVARYVKWLQENKA